MERDFHKVRQITAATPFLDERREICVTCGKQFVLSYRRGNARVRGLTCPLCEVRLRQGRARR